MSQKSLLLQRPALQILHQLQKNGFEAFIVGGAVRDLIAKAMNPDLPPEGLQATREDSYFDYDFTTNARPEEIQALFTDSFYENEFGTVSVGYSHLQAQFEFASPPPPPPVHGAGRLIDLAEATKIHVSLADQNTAEPTSATIDPNSYLPAYEITTYRSDGSYQDHRRPDQVGWGKTLLQDLERRDFTLNAMALKVELAELEKLLAQEPTSWLIEVTNYELIDPFEGLRDLLAREIKTVGEATERFNEDALRMLRAIRLAVQLGAKPHPTILEAITSQAADVRHVSAERIRDEFLKIIASPSPKQGLEWLDETGLLKFILPELLMAKGVEQAGHHTTDVWTHSLDALDNCPSSDPIVRLATLLHDIAKPKTAAIKDGQITFYNHEILGSRMATAIARRLKLSRRDTDRIFTLVRYHMFHYQPHNTDAAIRRFMRKVGLQNIDDILDLREGDRLGSGARKTSWRLEEMKERMAEQLHQPMTVTDLAISGHDLMDQLGLKPGPIIGQILNQLFEEVFENPELNQKEALLGRAQELISSAVKAD